MTGYHITIGYLSNGPSKKRAWEVLKQVALELCDDPERIAQEAIAFGMDEATAREHAASYKNCNDLTIRFNERNGDSPPQIMQLASGAGRSRLMKEAMRRAFCRLILHDMHRRGIEININVA